MIISLMLLAYPGYLGFLGLSAAADQRHHHRPDRSAALRGGGAAADARANPIAYAGLATSSSSGMPIPTSNR